MNIITVHFLRLMYRTTAHATSPLPNAKIINELYCKVNNNGIRDNPTTDFVLIRTHKAGIVARNRCCDLNQAGLSTKY